VANNEPTDKIDQTHTDPRQSAVRFVTTEHFMLQGARSSTISESTGRATMFIGAATGGLVALGLIATATNVGAAFYAFGLILLPTLTFLGLVTFDRMLQSGIEDYGYAHRIARLRSCYFRYAPELGDYLLSVPLPERLRIQGLRDGLWQGFLTIAGMIAVITAVIAGSAAAGKNTPRDRGSPVHRPEHGRVPRAQDIDQLPADGRTAGFGVLPAREAAGGAHQVVGDAGAAQPGGVRGDFPEGRCARVGQTPGATPRHGARRGAWHVRATPTHRGQPM
jgi:hypothetical protein